MTHQLRRDFRSLLTVAVLLATVLSVFPYEAFRFRADRVPRTTQASAAFVRLTAAEERAAFSAATTAWQAMRGVGRGVIMEMKLGELPSDEGLFRLNLAERPDPQVPIGLVYGASAFSPSQAAPKLVPLEAGAPEKAYPAFSREELLKLD